MVACVCAGVWVAGEDADQEKIKKVHEIALSPPPLFVFLDRDI